MPDPNDSLGARFQYESECLAAWYAQACDNIDAQVSVSKHPPPSITAMLDALAGEHIMINTNRILEVQGMGALFTAPTTATKSAILVAFEMGRLAERAGIQFHHCDCE